MPTVVCRKCGGHLTRVEVTDFYTKFRCDDCHNPYLIGWAGRTPARKRLRKPRGGARSRARKKRNDP